MFSEYLDTIACFITVLYLNLEIKFQFSLHDKVSKIVI